MTVLVVDHGHSTRCGIRDLGVRIAERLGAVHVDCNSWDDYVVALDTHDPDAVIFNYRSDLLPWWEPAMNIPELAVLHNYGPNTVDARAAELLTAGFDHVLVLDPTAQPTDPRVHAVGRPLPPAPAVAYEPSEHPRIGSFGYAFPHKGFADVAAEVATIPDAIYALHMPEAHFNGAQGAPLYTEGILADIRSRLNGHALWHTADELTPQELVNRLAGNTVNCLLYAPGQPDAGLSSALDYLIAAGRPMLLSDAEMFAACRGWAHRWPQYRLADVLGNLSHHEWEAGVLLDLTAGALEAECFVSFESAVNTVLDSL